MKENLKTNRSGHHWIINDPTAAAIVCGGPHAGVDAEPVVKREHVDCGRPAVRQH